MIADAELNARLDAFIVALRRRQVGGSYSVAKHTAELMRDVVASMRKGDDAQKMLDAVRKAGKKLVTAQPLEMVIGNIVRRILYIIREEYVGSLQEAGGKVTTTTTTPTGRDRSSSVKKMQQQQQQQPLTKTTTPTSKQTTTTAADQQVSRTTTATTSSNEGAAAGGITGSLYAPSLHNLLTSSNALDLTQPVDIKATVIEAINELIDEVSYIYKNISEQAIQHIHANEVILTYGLSHTVEQFLKVAAKKRSFEVIVAEHAPTFNGQDLVLSLSKDGISTTLIHDAAIFPIMARVNKVIIGTYAVMANGGLIAPSGTHMIALAAKHYSVPVVVCSGLYKLTPLYPVDQDSFNTRYSASQIIDCQDGNYLEDVHVINPAYDYIPPELISIFITNVGGHSPSYIYRLLAEYYNPEDYIL